MQIGGDVASGRFEVAQHRDALAHRFEVVEGELYACGSRNRQEVQHRIGGATDRHDDPQSRSRMPFLSGCCAAAARVHRPGTAPPPRARRVVRRFLIYCGHRRRVRQAHPIASIAADIVFAVNMPPHEPAPGQARRSISSSSSGGMRPAPAAPTASNTLTTVRFAPLVMTGFDRAAVDEDRGDIEPRESRSSRPACSCHSPRSRAARPCAARRTRSRSNRRFTSRDTRE